MEKQTTHLETELKKFDVTDAAIAELKNIYMPLKTNGVEDKEAFLAVKEARQIVKGKRVAIDKKRKELVADAVEFQRAVNGYAKEKTEKLIEIEEHLQIEEDKVVNELEKIKEEKQRKEQELIQTRTAKLITLGMAFNGSEYSKGLFTISSVELKSITQELFENIVSNIEAENEKEAKIKEEEEKAKQLEAERLDKQKKEQEAEQEKLNKQKAEQEAELAKIAAQKEAIEKQKEDMRIAMFKARASQLFSLGMKWNGKAYEFAEDIVVSKEFLESQTNEDWEIMVQALNEQILTVKGNIERNRLIEAKKVQEAADEQAKKDLAEKQEKEEKEAKEAEEKRLRLMPDKDKLDALAQEILEIGTQRFVSNECVAIAKEVNDMLVGVAKFIKKQKSTLYGE